MDSSVALEKCAAVGGLWRAFGYQCGIWTIPCHTKSAPVKLVYDAKKITFKASQRVKIDLTVV